MWAAPMPILELTSLAKGLQDSVCERIAVANLYEYVGLSSSSSYQDISTLVSEHFASVTPRYALLVDVDEVIHHLHLIANCSITKPSVTCRVPSYGLPNSVVLVTIVCFDRPKLLSNSIMHVLDSATKNILDADIMTTKHGLV